MSSVLRQELNLHGHGLVSDTNNFIPTSVEWSVGMQKKSEQMASDHMTTLEPLIPEVAAKRVDLQSGVAALIDEYQLAPEFFDTPEQSTVFLSLALAKAEVEQERDITVDPAGKREQARREAFIDSTTFLLTRGYSYEVCS